MKINMKYCMLILLLSVLITVSLNPTLYYDTSSIDTFFEDHPDKSMVCLINNPTKEQLSSINITDTLKLHENGERILLIPMMEYSEIKIWSVVYDDDRIKNNELIYSKKIDKLDFVLDLYLTISEDIPTYKLSIKTPKGYKDYLFTRYNKQENKNIEYIKYIE